MYFDKNKRYFVMSDLHGQGGYYDWIISDLEKQQQADQTKKIVLIINGDIIDRGPDSIRMLIDVMERVKGKRGNIEVIMLPGNHEMMMYEALKYLKEHDTWDNRGNTNSGIWFAPSNHGYDTALDFIKLSQKEQNDIYDFLGSLPLCCTLKSNDLNENSYGIIHAAPFSNIMTIPDEKIPKLSQIVSEKGYKGVRLCLTIRKGDNGVTSLAVPGCISIVGHTPCDWKNGFEIQEDGKVLMIDGGCGYIAGNVNSKMTGVATLVSLSPIKGQTGVQKYDWQAYRKAGKTR